MLKRVAEDPFIPIHWGKNQKGMQAEHAVSVEQSAAAVREWLIARDHAVTQTKTLLDIGIHKQITNRLLEPFLWQTVIVTATEWSNWDALRRHPDAQPEIKHIADLMYDARAESKPTMLWYNDWHLPLVPELDEHFAKRELGDTGNVDWEFWKKVSTGRCARVSYLTHDGRRDLQADIDLGDRLRSSGHMSPFEHVARPSTSYDFIGNFRGWHQYRKDLPHEADYAAAQASVEEVDC